MIPSKALPLNLWYLAVWELSCNQPLTILHYTLSSNRFYPRLSRVLKILTLMSQRKTLEYAFISSVWDSKRASSKGISQPHSEYIISSRGKLFRMHKLRKRPPTKLPFWMSLELWVTYVLSSQLSCSKYRVIMPQYSCNKLQTTWDMRSRNS